MFAVRVMLSFVLKSFMFRLSSCVILLKQQQPSNTFLHTGDEGNRRFSEHFPNGRHSLDIDFSNPFSLHHSLQV